MIKKTVFLIFSFIIFIFALFQAKPVETELSGAFLDPNSELVKLTNLSSKYLNVIFEGNSINDIEEMKTLLQEEKFDVKEITDIYKNYPENFLSDRVRNLIQNGDYKELDEESLERVYNPFGIYIAPLEEDPYLLSTDFALNHTVSNDIKMYQGKFYEVARFKIKNNEDIKKFLDIQKSVENGKIYLTGTPVHSYITSKKSALEINIICIISTLALILLCKLYFKSLKIIIPITLSILFGFLMGYSISSIIFHKLHILTFVFSTSLIGISLDYSLHFFLTGDEKDFKKNLTSSMLTTIIAFLTLLFSKMTILKQIAIFTSAGLLGVYLFVIIMFSKNLHFHPKKISIINFQKFKPILISLILIIIFTGFLNLKFNDNIKNLYTPPKNLQNSEKLYQKIFSPKGIEFIIIKGKTTDEILEKEEKLNLKNSICLANFISSNSRQKENQKLVKKLYSENLDKYGNFLSKEQIIKLKNKKMSLYDTENFPLNKEFMLSPESSYILVHEHLTNSISPALEITKYLTKLRKETLVLIPIVYFILLMLLSSFYGIKNALKIIISPLIGILFSLGLLSTLGVPINLFHILSLFLITGFSLDYSIFRLNSTENSRPAVFISAISSAFSFLLLAFTSFKLISSLGISLFIGITTSYLLSLFVIKFKNE